jgi:hypothetical protein
MNAIAVACGSNGVFVRDTLAASVSRWNMRIVRPPRWAVSTLKSWQ